MDATGIGSIIDKIKDHHLVQMNEKQCEDKAKVDQDRDQGKAEQVRDQWNGIGVSWKELKDGNVSSVEDYALTLVLADKHDFGAGEVICIIALIIALPLYFVLSICFLPRLSMVCSISNDNVLCIISFIFFSLLYLVVVGMCLYKQFKVLKIKAEQDVKERDELIQVLIARQNIRLSEQKLDVEIKRTKLDILKKAELVKIEDEEKEKDHARKVQMRRLDIYEKEALQNGQNVDEFIKQLKVD